MSDRKNAALILTGLAAFEGFWVVMAFAREPIRFVRFLGFAPGGHMASWPGWVLSLLVTLGFVLFSRRLPSVRGTMFRVDGLKCLAVFVAIAAGILEEWAFRDILMNALLVHGFSPAIQVFASGLSFGLMHSVWSLFRGNWQTAVSATVATGGLGIALATVFIVGERSLAPCVAAHFFINLLSEPGLVLAAVRGEMGSRPVTEITVEL